MTCPRCGGDGYADASTLTAPLFCGCVHGARKRLEAAAGLAPMAEPIIGEAVVNYHAVASANLERGRFTHLATSAELDQARDELLAWLDSRLTDRQRAALDEPGGS